MGVNVALSDQPSATALHELELAHGSVVQPRREQPSSTQRFRDLAALTVLVGVEIAWLTLLGYGAYRFGQFGAFK